ncbi:alkaline phosphatase [Malonomonas rubra DSM 5091]|uniref:Alkaline phosphatase n=1 Tax=Malonomonas rubra DSM 5091 TaxID=1122189 RepID=A0A1M6E2A9_MALRU|nr:alkaline phosphatase [Malonomonas rubra]SHI79581.1 alkaline phosphatase [Malonomonas rubra DSM 5091]
MLKKWKKSIGVAVVTGCLLLAATNGFAKKNHWKDFHQFKNVKNAIVMIPDGCDETVQTVARWYKGEDLAVDQMLPGTVKVHMANSVIPGSAAAATSFATGHKTTVRFLGVGPRTEDLLTGMEPTAAPYAPIASVIEAAQRAGKATGIISTSRVTHATPAAFAVHIHDRGMDNEIMEHMVYNNVDVVFGGGARHLIPTDESYTTSFGATWSGKRTDGENLMEVLKERGYQFVDSKDQLESITSGKVWGMFDDSHMQPDMDRQYFATHEPSLAEMVEKAIEILSQDEDGFLLMVEGSQVDWAGHNNDPIYMVTDFIAFDDAVKVATDFAEEDEETIVMAYPDHNTGGMKIGHYNTAVGYTETKIEDLVEPLKNMKTTANGVVAMMADDSDQALKDSVKENWNITLSDDDLAEINQLAPSVGLSYALARVISENHTVIGWTTHGHNGETVPLWMTGYPAPRGLIDNTDLAKIAADAIGVSLDKTTDNLYVDLDSVTHNYNIDMTDEANPVLLLAGAQLPISKDYMIKDGRTIQLPGLTVYAPMTGKVYVSKFALRTLRVK